jgi:hypothetical protein
MTATTDIVASYRGPGRVVARILAVGPREDRALIFLMIGCLMVFVAQTPRLAREAHLAEADLNILLGGSLMAWLFVAPLLLYVIAGLTHLIARAVGGKGTAYGARIALFWALLATSPLILLHGLTAGFIGPGLELNIVGVLWVLAFFWFWISGLRVAYWGAV